MKTKLLLLVAAIMAATSLTSCYVPGYGYGYNNYYYRPWGYGGYGIFNNYYGRPGYAYGGYRGPYYGHAGFGGYRPGGIGGLAHTGGFGGYRGGGMGGFHGGGFHGGHR